MAGKPNLFTLPADPAPPDPCPHCGEERCIMAGAGQAFCLCEWEQACEAEMVYRQTPDFQAFVASCRSVRRASCDSQAR